ncbi:MAG: CvpA family protein [Lachnospiraceae bacterium]|nr:CvpA family protein [Lachnospiraceae bacterium]
MWTEYLPIIIDAACVLILSIFFVSGCREGLAGKLLRALSIFFAVVITYLFYAKLAEVLRQAGFEEFLFKKIMQKIGDVDENGLPDLIPSYLKEGIMMNNTMFLQESMGAESLREYAGRYFARFLLNTASILVIFLASWTILVWLASKLRLLNKLPLVGTVNAVLGGIVNAVIGFVLMLFVVFVITALGSGNAAVAIIADAIDKSYIASLLQNINWFAGWASTI